MLVQRLALVLAAALACGSCDALGIGMATVDGEWVLSARNLSDGSNVCSIPSLVLTFTQTRDRFSGVSAATTVSCTIDGAPRTLALPVQPVVDGKVNGDDVTFWVGGSDWKHVARVVASSSMSGSVEVRFGPPIGSTTFTGSFAAARTDSVSLLRQVSMPSR